MLNTIVKPVLADEHILDVAALSYSDCCTTRPYLLERLSPFIAHSVVLFLVPYYAGETENISRYAAARDYHLYMQGLFARLCPRLQAACGYAFHGFSDHSPIDERQAALAAGLGYRGENGLLIHPRYGSFVFIGALFTDMPPSQLGVSEPIAPQPCLGCGACRMACPAGHLDRKGKPCLSAITQKKGDLTGEERALLLVGKSAWGCDICQTVCPHNAPALHGKANSPIPFFHTARITHLTEQKLFAMPQEEFDARAFSFRGKDVLLRNLHLLDT